METVASSIPSLSTRSVTSTDDLQRFVESIEAELTGLEQELRSAQSDVEGAEVDAAATSAVGREDNGELAQLVRSVVNDRVSTRRAEMQADIERARKNAAELVAAAEEQARSIRNEGTQSMLRLLLDDDPRVASAPAAPSRTITPVTSDLTPTPSLAPPAPLQTQPTEPAQDANREMVAPVDDEERSYFWSLRTIMFDVLVPLVLAVTVIGLLLALLG